MHNLKSYVPAREVGVGCRTGYRSIWTHYMAHFWVKCLPDPQQKQQQQQQPTYLENVSEYLISGNGALELPPQTDWDTYAHDPHEPRENQVANQKAVPSPVLQEPVAPRPVVHKYHKQY